MNIKDAYIHNGLGVLRELQVTAAGMLQLKRAAKDSNDAYVGWEDVYNLTNIKPTNAGTADNVPWTGITGKPDTFPVATHDHDDRYLKLSGGTMTGVIERQYNAASNEPVLKIGSANKDIQIFKVYSNDIATYSDTVSGYGYALQYIGSGSGVSNYLRLIADNSTGTKKTAMSINQSGQVGILADPNTSYALYVNGATNINGDITASSFKKSGGTSSQFLKADGSVDSNSYALSTHNHNSLDIVPIMSKTYGGTEFYATASGNWDLASRFFMSVIPEGADKYWRIKYHIKVWVPSSNLMTDSIVEYYGSGITMKAYKIWNTHGPTHATYYHVALWLKSAGLSAGYGHMIGESILYATSYTTAASYRHMTVDLLEYEGCTVNMLDTAVKYTDWTGYSSTNYNSINSYNATSAGLQETGDNDDLSIVQQTYTLLQAGANGIKGYSLIMQDDEGKWQSIHTSAVSTGTTKNVNTAKFRLDSNVYYMNRSSDLAAGSYLGTSQVRVFSPNVDFRYSLNNITANGTGLTAYKPIYLVGTLDSEGYFKLDTNYWTQTAPTTADGKIYIKVCEAVYLNYSTNVNGSYTGDFGNFGIYQFRNGRLQKFINYAVNADKLNGFSASDFRNNIIDLRTSPQTFNPTYLKDIVFISEADYTSLVSNGSITKNSITHTYNSSNWYVIPDKVPEYAETAGSVAWSNVTSKPDTATRWPSWNEVTGKPSTFAPSSHTHYATRYQDSRNTAMTPTNAVAVHGLAIDFKTKANGVNAGSGLYCGLVTMDPYSDASGGYPMQMGFNTGADTNNTNELYIRTAKDADNWNEWRTVITSINIGAQTVSSATTATYASNVGTSADHVTAAQVKALHTWYTTVAGNNASGVIDNWNEIKNFIDGFHETDDLATYLTNTFLAKSGGTMTGQIKWTDSTALPEQTSPQYFVCIDAFNSGGTTKWASKANTLKALTGLTSTAVGDSDEPVYWDGSKFVKAGAYPTKASWNYDDVYLKLSGGTLTGALEVPASTSSGGEHTKGLNLGSVGHLGAVSATGATGVGLYSTEKIWIRPGQTNIASGTVDTTKGLVIDATTFTYNGNTVYHSGNLPVPSTVNTITRSTDASHYLVFVDSNNTSATAETLYTSTNIIFNPNKGSVSLNSSPTSNASKTNYLSAGPGYSTAAGKYGVKVISCDQSDCQTGLGQDLGMVSGWSGWSNTYNLSIAGGNDTSDVGKISFVTHKVNSTTYRYLGGFLDTAGVIKFNVQGDGLFTGSVGVGTSDPGTTLDVRGITSIYPMGEDNTLFKGSLIIKQQNSVEGSNGAWDETKPSFGIQFNRFWTSGNGGAYGETPCAGMFATVSSSWRAGLVFRTKNNTTNGGTHDISALILKASGAAVFASTVTATSFVSTVATGTQPYACTSTTLNEHLNADLLDGKHADDFATSGHDHNTLYVKLDAGTAEQTIKNSIGNISNGSIEIWRATSGGYPMIGFATGTTKTKLGFLGFGATANEPLFRNTSGTDYKLLHSGNYTTYTVKKDGTGASGTWGIDISGNASSASYAKRLASNSSTNVGGLSYYYIGGSTSNTTVDGSWSGSSASTKYNSIVRLQSHTGDAKYYIDLIFDVNNSEIYYRRVTNNSLATIRQIDVYEVPESTDSYSLSNASWLDTITLPTAVGSYMITLISGNSTLTGVFSIGASDNAKDEINLHLHGNGPRLYARTNGNKLQLSSNDAAATPRSVTIKYRKMI